MSVSDGRNTVHALFGVLEMNERSLDMARTRRTLVQAEIAERQRIYNRAVYDFGKAVEVVGQPGPFLVNLKGRGLLVRVDRVASPPGVPALPGQPGTGEGFVVTKIEKVDP